MNALASKARAATAGLEPAARADRLLQFLHSGELKRYEFYQTRVDVLLDTGAFNCVSSAIVYNLTAEAIGLKTAAVETPDHAFSQVILPDRTVDVETTSALGFDPGQKREFHDAFGKLTGFAYVPPGNYSKRTSIDDGGLIVLILRNLMTEAQSRGDTVSPVGLSWDVRVLDPSSESDALVVRSYQNYLVGLNRSGDYSGGLDILTRLESILGRNAQIDQLTAAFAQNLIVTRMGSGDYSGAREAVQRWSSRTSRSGADWNGMILKAQAQTEYRNAGWAASLKWLDGFRQSNPREVLQLRASLTLQELQKRSAGNAWDAALSFWDSLPADLKAEQQIGKMGAMLSYNASVDYHNRFAALMNQGDIPAAKAVLQEGRGRFPLSTLLQQDQRQLARRTR